MPVIINFKESDIQGVGGEPLPFQCLARIEKRPHLGNLHFHRYAEILMCVKGEINVICGDSKISMNEGDLIYIAPNQLHTIEYLEEYSQHYCIKFEPKLLHYINSYTNAETIGNIVLSRLNKYEFFCNSRCNNFTLPIVDIFAKAIEEYGKNDYCHFFMVQAYISQIMTFIIREKNASIAFDNSTYLIEKISKYIDENYATVTLRELSEHFNISYNYFSKLFSDFFGINFKAYINRVKIEKSIPMLTEKNLSVTDIALNTGFSSISHYIKTFKSVYGTTPYQHRKYIK